MDEYKKLYYELFNDITDLIEGLKEIQQEAEEIFISSNILKVPQYRQGKHRLCGMPDR